MRIAIIGASSQVGSSLALYFKQNTDVVPVCFIRSTYSVVFFETSEIEYRIINRDEWLKTDFADIDAVVDCTYPSGQLYEIERLVKTQLQSLFKILPPQIIFIYLSTIMAFGMPDKFKYVKYFFIPRSTYAYLKRRAEVTVRRLSQQYKISGYNFRLGQVHGFLQSVNASYREKFSMNKTIFIDGHPTDLTNIIFISNLAQAIIVAAKKNISPGTYSLVNKPQWTLSQLYKYYQEYYSLQNDILFTNYVKRSLKQRLSGLIISNLKNYRSLLETFFLIRNEKLYAKIKGRYRFLEVKRSITMQKRKVYTDFHILGKNPGKIIDDLQYSPNEVFISEKLMEKRYKSNLIKNVKATNGNGA
ncbi:MAG: hypothetical protein JWN83_1868 [Chitinophagaceae bacterium]|nr:hypothetical protein [Chitinophagaceae bacterium]